MMAHQTFIVVEYLSARSSWDVKQELVIDLEQGTFHSKESPDQEGRLQLQMACMLALDEEYPQAVPPKAEKDGQAELELPTKCHPALRTSLEGV